jgi:F-type H+-transporting ATPase subunit alpha
MKTTKVLADTVEQELINRLNSLIVSTEIKNVGTIERIGDGIAIVTGVSAAMMGEIVEFAGGTTGVVLNLQSNQAGIILFGEYRHLKEGDEAHLTGRVLDVPVGPEMLGRVVNGLGVAIDGKAEIKSKNRLPVENVAAGVIDRSKVNQPLQTGIVAIDSMIPIGRGQRELIIGDRGTGKSSIALTTIINQKNENVKCIYVAIGQKRSYVAQFVGTLEKYDALDYTTVVAATSSDPASMQYIAPYAATAIGEYFAQNGQDALIIYDDLSKHAWAYRELSLLLRRPSGREAYPGDVFYLHSRLLERSLKYNQEKGGGSLTSLPIIETQAGDVSAYIPTNVISITDGQIYLESDLFFSGFRPAVNAGLSVSRVGGDAQIKAMKKVAGKLRLDLAQYRELAAFSQFSTDLDPKTKEQLDRGKRVSELLKQGWDTPLSVGEQIVLIWATTEGYADQITIENMGSWKDRLLEYTRSAGSKLVKSIVEKKELNEEIVANLKKALTRFNEMNEDLMEQEAE